MPPLKVLNHEPDERITGTATVTATVFEHFLCLELDRNVHSHALSLVSLCEVSLEFTVDRTGTLLQKIFPTTRIVIFYT